MTNRKKAICKNCSTEHNSIFTKEIDFDQEGIVYVWKCANCGATKPLGKSTRQSYDFVTKEATSVEQVRKLADKAAFTYFNPNGAYAVKQAADDRITAAVDAGLVKSGAIIAYGSMNDYHYNSMTKLIKQKNPKKWDVFYMIDGLLGDAKKANDFVDGLG